jgi:hypothetical protein
MPAEEPVLDGRTERQRQALAKLEAGYEAAAGEAGFRAYLRVVTHLYQYSPRNVALIFAQDDQATMVNSYDRWQAMGRQVKQGERGLKVSYPQHRWVPEEDAATGQVERRQVLVGFGLGTVFDVRQTAGDPIPEPPTPQETFGTTEIAPEIDRRLSLHLIGSGMRLETGNCLSARGFFRPGEPGTPHTIRLAEGRLKTFMHEAAHVLIGHHEQGHAWDDKPRKELEAEGVAFAVMDYWGMDSSQYSFSYLASYGRTADNLRQSMPVIAQTTRTLIELVEGEQPDGEEEWL